MDLSVPATIETDPWGEIAGKPVGGGFTKVTVTLHLDDTAENALRSLLMIVPTPVAALSAQDLANQYSSAELIAAFQLAVKAGK